jgi:hypothetical protein
MAASPGLLRAKLARGAPGVYPTLFDWVGADCGMKQISGLLGYSEITQKSGGVHFSWKPPLNC